MIDLFMSNCKKCKNLIGCKQPDGTENTEIWVCKAYKDGIPGEILSGKIRHIKPHIGDNGIVFRAINI